jgi:hypothetical protein
LSGSCPANVSRVLAYVFWHRPAATPAADGYESGLVAFHEALRAHPPTGFRSSRSFRLDAAPWLPGDGTPYEDWYVVDSWAALGALNLGAVSGARSAPHDAVARLARGGAGGVYAPVRGAEPGPGEVAWLAKPPEVSYVQFHVDLAERGAGAVWQRQMVLGPAAEYVVEEPSEALPWPAVAVRREAL